LRSGHGTTARIITLAIISLDSIADYPGFSQHTELPKYTDFSKYAQLTTYARRSADTDIRQQAIK
jgi:hypothetical protein